MRGEDREGKGVYVTTGAAGGSAKYIAKFEQHSTSNKGHFELLYDGQTRIISESWGTEIKGGELRCNDDIVAFFASASDQNLKDNITLIEDPLAKVLSISGNTFNWNEKSAREGTLDTGVIAQQVEALGLPGLVKTKEDGFKTVHYDKLIPLLIEAIKELNAKVDALS